MRGADVTSEPAASPVEAPAVVFDRWTTEGKLPYQLCDDCNTAFHPPRVLCPRCGSTRVPWNVSAGIGTVYSMTTISPRDQAPYVVAIIDVGEGFRVMAEVGTGEPGIGSAVKVDPSRTTTGTVVFAATRKGEAA